MNSNDGQSERTALHFNEYLDGCVGWVGQMMDGSIDVIDLIDRGSMRRRAWPNIGRRHELK